MFTTKHFINTLSKHISKSIFFLFLLIFVCTSTPLATYASAIVFYYIKYLSVQKSVFISSICHICKPIIPCVIRNICLIFYYCWFFESNYTIHTNVSTESDKKFSWIEMNILLKIVTSKYVLIYITITS